MSAGGPIWIPKVVNGKDKLFWFFSYEGIHDAFPEPLTQTVATAAERNGDFSQLLTRGRQLRDLRSAHRRAERQPRIAHALREQRDPHQPA